MKLELRLGEAGQEWLELVRELEGGFFHLPPALSFAMPEGEPAALLLRSDTGTVGAALGVAQRCRLRGLHLRLATPAALAPGVDPLAAARTIAGALRARRVAEYRVGSFGAPGIVALTPGAQAGLDRVEFVLDLQRDPQTSLAAMARSHRRNVRRGDGFGWRLRVAVPEEGAEVLHQVQREAARRAHDRGAGFDTSRLRPAAVRALATSLETTCGAAVFVAEDEGGILGAALVGWGNGQAYNLRGGATPHGYERDSSIWTQWAIMMQLRESGIRTYNLGGVPASAAIEGAPQHGLYTYKKSFGAEAVRCRGGYWNLRPLHQAAHGLLERLTRR